MNKMNPKSETCTWCGEPLNDQTPPFFSNYRQEINLNRWAWIAVAYAVVLAWWLV